MKNIFNIHTCCNFQLFHLFMHLLQLNYLHTLQTIYTLTETLTNYTLTEMYFVMVLLAEHVLTKK